MKTSDLFFSASYHEGFGIPILEAMSYDLPIITRCGAIPKVISKNSLVYSSLEDAALMINQFISKPISSYPIKHLNSFYRTIYNDYSDENIFEFFERKILK